MAAVSDLTVAVTGCGAPGFPGTLHSLRANYDDHDVRVVGVDMRAEQAGRHLADAFVQVPPADAEGFVPALLDVCRSEGVDVVLPQVTRELPTLAERAGEFERGGTAVAVAGPDAVRRANDKAAVVDACAAVDVPHPETYVADTGDDLVDACRRLGHPDVPVVVKPPSSNGGRGVRILDADRDRKRAFYAEKPTGRHATLPELSAVLGESFPRLLVMEHLPGVEFTVDAFRPEGGETVVVPRRRDEVRAGISFRATVVDDAGLVDATRRLADELDLAYAFGFQFKRDREGTPKILECNPRVQGTMVTSTVAGANVVYSAVKHALGEPVPAGELDPAWDCSFYRYWGGVGIRGGDVVGDLGGSR